MSSRAADIEASTLQRTYSPDLYELAASRRRFSLNLGSVRLCGILGYNILLLFARSSQQVVRR